MCIDGVCVPDVCEPPCGCGEICIAGECLDLCSASQTPCGCSGCCNAGEECNPITGMCAIP
jgi:hypothetical protein